MTELRSSDPSSSNGYEEVEYVEEVVYEEVEEEVEEVAGTDHKETSGSAGGQEPGPRDDAFSPGESSTAVPAAAAPDTSQVVQPPPANTPAGPPPAKPRMAEDAQEAAAAQALLGASEPTYVDTSDFRLIEQQAAKVAGEVQHVAADLSKKLQSTILSAWGGAASTTGASTAPAAAAGPAHPAGANAAAGGGGGSSSSSLEAGAASITSLAGKLGSWWSTLDQQLASNNAPAGDAALRQQLASCTSADPELAALFHLAPGEHLVEQYNCHLQQTYCCSHNNLTPSMQVVFPGTLYITDRSSCFKAQGPAEAAAASAAAEPSSPGPSAATGSSSSRSAAAAVEHWFKVPHAAVVSASHAPGARKRVGGDVLRVEVDGEQARAAGFASSSSSVSRGTERSSTSGSRGGAEGQPVAGDDGAAAGAAAEGPEKRWHLVFTDFDPASGLDGALALIEHLRDSAAAEQQV